jgi:hypothetical protein
MAEPTTPPSTTELFRLFAEWMRNEENQRVDPRQRPRSPAAIDFAGRMVALPSHLANGIMNTTGVHSDILAAESGDSRQMEDRTYDDRLAVEDVMRGTSGLPRASRGQPRLRTYATLFMSRTGPNHNEVRRTYIAGGDSGREVSMDLDSRAVTEPRVDVVHTINASEANIAVLERRWRAVNQTIVTATERQATITPEGLRSEDGAVRQIESVSGAIAGGHHLRLNQNRPSGTFLGLTGNVVRRNGVDYFEPTHIALGDRPNNVVASLSANAGSFRMETRNGQQHIVAGEAEALQTLVNTALTRERDLARAEIRALDARDRARREEQQRRQRRSSSDARTDSSHLASAIESLQSGEPLPYALRQRHETSGPLGTAHKWATPRLPGLPDLG